MDHIWLITEGLNNATTTVLHLRFKETVDLSDFWTTESMEVTVKPCTCDADKLSQSEREEKRVIEASAQKVGNQWMIPYPWKEDPRDLPDNNGQPGRRLESNRTPIIKGRLQSLM